MRSIFLIAVSLFMLGCQSAPKPEDTVKDTIDTIDTILDVLEDEPIPVPDDIDVAGWEKEVFGCGNTQVIFFQSPDGINAVLSTYPNVLLGIVASGRYAGQAQNGDQIIFTFFKNGEGFYQAGFDQAGCTILETV